MRLDVRQLITDEMTIRKWRGGIKEVTKVELPVWKIGAIVAAQVNMDCCCPAAWVNIVVGIDGVEEYERVGGVVGGDSARILSVLKTAEWNYLEAYMSPESLSSTKNIAGASGSGMIDSDIGAFMSFMSKWMGYNAWSAFCPYPQPHLYSPF